MKRIAFIAITIAIPIVFLVAAAAVLRPRIEARLQPLLLNHMMGNLTDAERKEIYDKIARGTAFWEAIPDPDVAGLAQRNRTVTEAGTEVRLNNVGFRADRDYSDKRPGTFRIVCLGDSFVFGMGGPEADRFCDQLQAIYGQQGIRADGKPIETYAIGLPSWTLVQSTTYLATRITSYDPDLIIVLSVANDITDNMGVTGTGALTYSFSPEYRSLGSAMFSDDVNQFFGDADQRAALSADLSPASRRRWDKAMQRLKRLADLQHSRGKQILISAMTWGKTDSPDTYAVLFQANYQRHAINAPFLLTSFLPSRRTTLPHDGHPNQLGHRILRDQYVHALQRLEWIQMPDTALPELDRGTPVRINPPLDQADYETHRRNYLRNLRGSIDFAALQPRYARAFLGGIFPEFNDPARALETPPWASLQTAFLLRRPDDGALRGVEVDIEIPARPELFPFQLTMRIDGAKVAALTLERPNESGRYRISGAPVIPAFYEPVVEVSLETDSYFSGTDDVRMKSYRLLQARAF